MNSWHPLRHMDTLEGAMETRTDYTGMTRWMIPYADLLTLLLGFFIIMFAVVKIESLELHQEKTASQQAMEAAQKRETVANQVIEQLSAKMHLNPAEVQQWVTTASHQTATSEPQLTDETLRDLEETLIKPLNRTGQQVTVSQDSRGLVISLQERIFFEPGKATLTPASKKTLAALANVLMPLHHPIRVEGHTDNTPIKTATYPSNWELSTARATNIVRTLAEQYHFPPQRLSAAGYGEYFPLADNSTIEGKQKNRRVDIVILNPLPGLSEDGPSMRVEQNLSKE